MIEAAIFDLDGTLVNLPINYEALYEKFKKIIGTKNIEPVTRTVAALNPAIRDRVFEAWTAAELAALPNATVVEEGMRLYQQYYDSPKALVTMQGKKTVRQFLDTSKLSFQAIVTREDSLDRTTQIKLAVKKLGARPENVIVIGDRETDRSAAENVGCKFKNVKL